MAPGFQLQPRHWASAESADHGRWQGPRHAASGTVSRVQEGTLRWWVWLSLTSRPLSRYRETWAWKSEWALGVHSRYFLALRSEPGGQVSQEAPRKQVRPSWPRAILSPRSLLLCPESQARRPGGCTLQGLSVIQGLTVF